MADPHGLLMVEDEVPWLELGPQQKTVFLVCGKQSKPHKKQKKQKGEPILGKVPELVVGLQGRVGLIEDLELAGLPAHQTLLVVDLLAPRLSATK